MRIKLVLWAWALAIGLGAAEVTAQSHPLAPILPTNASLSRLKLMRMWWGTATMNASRDKLVFLSLDDNQLYAHTSSGILNCFDSETGRKLWACSLGGEDEPAFPPVANEHIVIIPSGSTLFALNKHTGDILWQFALPRSPSTPPIIDESQVYVGTTDGSLMAFDLTSLTKFFDRRLSNEASNLAIQWRYKISAQIQTQPVSSGDLISFTGTNRTTYTISRGRDLRYTFDTPAPVSAGLTTNRGLLFICSADARVFALDVENGTLRWQTVVGSPIVQTPRVIQDDLFLTPQGIGMFRLRARDGIELWSRPARGVDQFVGASPEAVYGADRALNLVRMSRATGEIQGRVPLDRFTVRISNDLTDRIYMATPDGMIIALREKERELPLFFKFPERLPVMPEFAPEEPVSENKPAEEKAAADTVPEEKPAEEEKPQEEKPAEGETSN